MTTHVICTSLENDIPVSTDRLGVCLRDARYWAQHLGEFSAKLQAKSDAFQTAATLLAALTAGTLWAVVSSSTALWAEILVTVMALLTAFVTAYPKARNYSRGAAEAAQLTADYGRLYGRLLDADRAVTGGQVLDTKRLQELVEEFQDVRSRRQTLHPRPVRLERERPEGIDDVDSEPRWAERYVVVEPAKSRPRHGFRAHLG
ncbi:hypothetical protein AB0C76_05800 [Kitasatospora sp. NPDC048722]|uniref:hypothetical protein n=1 Tax=Kitasatospora sp. NPDC048722 TaxID=3155639 RepID=UPI0033CE87B7